MPVWCRAIINDPEDPGPRPRRSWKRKRRRERSKQRIGTFSARPSKFVIRGWRKRTEISLPFYKRGLRVYFIFSPFVNRGHTKKGGSWKRRSRSERGFVGGPTFHVIVLDRCVAVGRFLHLRAIALLRDDTPTWRRRAFQ